MIVLDLQYVVFILVCCLLFGLGIAFALMRRPSPQSSAHPCDAWRLLDRLPFGVIITEGEAIVFMSQSAGQLLPDTHATLGELGLLVDAQTAQHGWLVQPVPLRWWSQPLDEQHTLIVLSDERDRQRMLREQQAFIGQLSHELRSPLTALLAHITIARDASTPTAITRSSLATIQHETERMARLVRDLLELHRVETAYELLLKPTNLALVTEEALSACFLQAEARGIELALETDAALPRVLAAPDQLTQVFVNLLDNAVKYCRPGDRVVVRLRSEPGGVQCMVQDTGPGIAAADLPHVMERLHRGRTDVEGSGIGLALVRAILRQHGTDLEITSATEGEHTGTICAWELQQA